MGKVNLSGILVLQLLQAAARAAIAQAFPFDVGHFLQRLGFPEETLLARWLFGRRGHKSLRFRNDIHASLHWGRFRQAASGGQIGPFCPAPRSSWRLKVAAGPLVYGPSSARTTVKSQGARESPWVCRNISARRPDGAPPDASTPLN